MQNDSVEIARSTCTAMLARGELPTIATVHQAVRDAKGGNPSVTTIKKGIDLWRANELKALTAGRQAFTGLSEKATGHFEQLVSSISQDMLDQANQALAEEQQAARDQVDQARAQVAQAQDSLEKAQDEALIAKSAASEVRSMLEARETALAVCQQQLQDARAQLAGLQAQLKANEEQMLAERQRVTNQIAELKRGNDGLEHARKQAMLAQDRERAERETAQAQARSERETAKTLMVQLSNAGNRVAASEASLSEARRETQSAVQNIARLQAQVVELNHAAGAAEQLQTQLDLLRGQLAQVQRQRDRYAAALARRQKHSGDEPDRLADPAKPPKPTKQEPS